MQAGRNCWKEKKKRRRKKEMKRRNRSAGVLGSVTLIEGCCCYYNSMGLLSCSVYLINVSFALRKMLLLKFKSKGNKRCI